MCDGDFSAGLELAMTNPYDTVVLDLGPHEGVVNLQDLPPPRVAQMLCQLRRADHVGHEDGQRPPRQSAGVGRLGAQLAEGCGVGFAGLGGASADAALEVSVIGHCQAFHGRAAFPSNTPDTIGP